MDGNFGVFLKQKRQEKNLTQKELAGLLFVSESAVSKWEKNIAHPDITLLPKLSAILGVSEHELITASVDNRSREEKVQAKKWRTLSMSWSLFFYIAYAVALIPCFICNLAINKTLSWFWIVLSALILAFTFTNLPKLIKKHKLIFVPLSMYLAFVLLIGVCCIYTCGSWFFIPTIAVFLGLMMVFAPIYIAKYDCFAKIRKYNDFVSVATCFVILNIMLITIDLFSVSNGANHWYLPYALPISLVVYLIINALMCIRFLKLNKLLKTGIILGSIDVLLYLVPLFINVDDIVFQKEINRINIFEADFSRWIAGVTLEQNVHCIIFLTIAVLALVFTGFGIWKHIKNKNKQISK